MDMIETKALEFAYPAEEGEKPVLALRGVDTAIEKGIPMNRRMNTPQRPALI